MFLYGDSPLSCKATSLGCGHLSLSPLSTNLKSWYREPAHQIMMFRDQVGVLAGWFKGWNECEQTVALLSLLKRVSRTQARFLQLCLEHSLADCTELHVLEREANNPGQYRSYHLFCQYTNRKRAHGIELYLLRTGAPSSFGSCRGFLVSLTYPLDIGASFRFG